MINKSVMKCCICNNDNIGEFITINGKKYHLCCIEQLKKQKDDVVEFIIKLYQKEHNKTSDWWLQEELCNNFDDLNIFTDFELERMLGEIDD